MVRYNVEKTNKQVKKKYGYVSENTNTGWLFPDNIIIIVVNPSSRVNLGLNMGYLARGADPT